MEIFLPPLPGMIFGALVATLPADYRTESLSLYVERLQDWVR